MVILDVDATFEKIDKLRLRIDRLEKTPTFEEWQYTRLLIRALTESISKSKKISVPISRKVPLDAPEAIRGDWQELVDVLFKMGITSESQSRTPKRKALALP